MPARWPREKEMQLRGLVRTGRYTYPEIARKMGISKHMAVMKAGYLGLKNPVYRQRKTKHKHLRRPVMEYYLNHSALECQKRFGLTPSEFKSILTVSYRDPELKHLRKDTRTKRPFKHEDWIFIAAHAGLMPRGWIAKKLGRSRDGRFHVVKERLRSAGVSTRYLPGLTHSLAKGLLPEVAFVSILTKAGSPGCSGNTQTRIVPWVMLEDLTRSRRIDPTVRAGIRAMARFQRWVYGAKTNREALESILTILKGEKNAKRTRKGD